MSSQNGAMDRLELRVRGNWDKRDVVDIYINGRLIVELIEEVEFPFAQKDGNSGTAGGYQCDGDPKWTMKHLLDYGKRVIDLIDHGCGGGGCWPCNFTIALEGNRVIWKDFGNPHRPHWKYDKLGPFVFDKMQYETEVRKLNEHVKS